MTVRVWRCRRVRNGVRCDTLNLRIKQKCTACGGKRPTPSRAAHRAALDATTYEQCVATFGDICGICGAAESARRLHRDHEHKGAGAIRGLLCFRCNSALRTYLTLDWLRAAVAYLERFEARRKEIT